MNPHPYFMSQVPDTIRLTRLGPGPKGAGFLTRRYEKRKGVLGILVDKNAALFNDVSDAFNRVFLAVDEMKIVPLTGLK